MANINVEKLIAILKGIGVNMSAREATSASVSQAAQRLGIQLNDEDKAALESVVKSLRSSSRSTASPGMVGLQMNILHIPEYNTPAGKRRPGKTGESVVQATDERVPDAKLPPWGKMNEGLQADIDPPIPLDWLNMDGSEPTYADWSVWLTKLADEIGRLIWPQYEPDSASWTNAAVGDLINADFALLDKLHPNLGLPIAGLLPTTVQHLDFFIQEDNRNIRFGTGYEAYDNRLPKAVLDSLTTVLTAGIVDKVGSLDLQLKQLFQRPRPYQVAFIQGRDEYSYLDAVTANTPSLVCGHCLQASLGGCTVFATFRGSITGDSIDYLKQFMVDVGDRRVFAGVHYPSDNLSSWLTALRLVPHVFDIADVIPIMEFLWDAIDSKSAVFSAIKEHVAANANSPYKDAVDALRATAIPQRGHRVG